MREMDIIETANLTDEPDVFIAAVGYERRCRHVLTSQKYNPASVVALLFDFHRDLSFEENYAAFEKWGAHFLCQTEDTAARGLKSYLGDKADAFSSGKDFDVLVDISAMSRSMMADVVLALSHLSSKHRVRLRCCYSPAKFLPPSSGAPMRFAGPVRAEFAGWSVEPDRPLCLVMGLGYEEDLAVGAIAFLEPSIAFLFIPEGLDPKYKPYVMEEAEKISAHVGSELLLYDLRNWKQSLSIMRRLTAQLLRSNRVVVVPFGPKVFAWNAMCLGMLEEFHDLSVWRFSSEAHGKPVDREAAGPVMELGLALR